MEEDGKFIYKGGETPVHPPREAEMIDFTANSTLKILRRKIMDKETYEIVDTYMQACMAADTAHDKNHIYRVLYAALTIAEHEAAVDYDCLIAACLLHDIGRKEQFENSKVCHTKAGAKKA